MPQQSIPVEDKLTLVQDPFTNETQIIEGTSFPRGQQHFIDNSSDKLKSKQSGQLQNPHKMTQDSLKRLEVESASSESVSAAAITQYPYYNLDDVMVSPSPNSQSQSQSQISHKYTPPSPNKQQYSGSGSGSGSAKGHQRISYDGIPLSPIGDDAFNQVPKRFSQFIIDQQNPYISQRLDNLSMISSSLKSDHVGHKKHDDGSSRNERDTTSSSNHNKSKTTHGSSPIELPSSRSRSNNDFNLNHHSTQLSSAPTRDDVSDSMGSQATIFSTRQEPEALLLINRRVSKINTGLSKTKSLFNKNKSNGKRSSKSRTVNRTSTVRLYKSPTSSITSSLLMNRNANGNNSNVRGATGSATSSSLQSSTSLTRHNAIKTKKGSWWYRLQLKIRQFWTKFKFYNFKASSSKKRQVSIKKRGNSYKNVSAARGETRGVSSSNLKKSKSLVRKVRENPQNQDLKRLTSIKLSPGNKLNQQMEKDKGVSGIRSGSIAGAKRLQISAPVNNPELGKLSKVERVELNDDLKRYAGAQHLPPASQQQGHQQGHQQPSQHPHHIQNNQLLTPEEIADESTGKYNHLSNYINQQESRYLYQSQLMNQEPQIQSGRPRGGITTGASPSGAGAVPIAVGVLNSKKPLVVDDDNEFPSPQIGTSEIDQPSWTSSSAVTSQAPPPVPPPHLDTSYMTQHSRELHHHQQQQEGEGEEEEQVYTDEEEELDKNKINQLWQSYLMRVLYNRIQLRQEINQFEQYLVTRETSDVINMIFERARHDAESEDERTTIGHAPSRNTSIVTSKPEPDFKSKDNAGYIKSHSRSGTRGETSVAEDTPVGVDIDTEANSVAAVDVDADVGVGAAASASSIYSQDDVISTTTFSTISSTTTTNQHGDVFIDPQDQEFTSTVLNRRSMLGEMLEYHSSEEDEGDEEGDNDDTISYYESVSQLNRSAIGSVKTQGSLVSSTGGLDELRRYGTVIKRPSLRAKSNRPGVSGNANGGAINDNDEQALLPNNGSPSGLKRSFGLVHSLSQLTTK
ncbi:hypothetical protein CANMA_001553 [Candida margitis]|uniref:uncharacterized protein n=1 Tax=Candida margitis TaxID=1775924 RepID=UPI0022274D1C|nr:uncharacterized protein CANMA_001553 [Candida margitis]KAI5969485.1 hypothetical protein CANMA_001553 [Candida margitis]